MDLLAEFQRSEMLMVSVSGDYTVEPALVRAGSFRVLERCVPKAPGLGWVLSPGQVGLPDLPVALELRGERAGVDAGGRPLIRFTVDQDLDVRVPERHVVLERARGAIAVALSPPAAATAEGRCGPGVRVAAALLETTGEDNGFEIELRARLLGFRRRATVHVTNLQIHGTAWRKEGPR